MKYNADRLATTSLVVLGIIALLPGCTKEATSEFTDTPVIEAYLGPGSPLEVVIKRQVPFSDNATFSADDVSALALTISNGTDQHMLISAGNGHYVDATWQAPAGSTHTLSFLFNGKRVTATTSIPARPASFAASASTLIIPPQSSQQGPPEGAMPDPLQLSWTNSDASYYFLVVSNLEEVPDPIATGGEDRGPKAFKTQPTNSNTSAIRPLDFTYYGLHRIILYHVRPDYAALYSQASNNSQNLTNASSSIVNGYGIFTGLNSDTLFVEVLRP